MFLNNFYIKLFFREISRDSVWCWYKYDRECDLGWKVIYGGYYNIIIGG